MITLLAIIVAVLLISVLIYVASQPDTFRVERSVSIKASPEKIFPLINDFHHMQTWSAWEKVDPAMKRTYSGAESGKGAIYAWEGNTQIGQGRMEIVESNSPSKILFTIDFFKPIEGHNLVEFTLISKGDVTVVTHAMFGPSPFISKIMSLFFSMDKMVGSKFEEGLATLKAHAER